MTRNFKVFPARALRLAAAATGLAVLALAGCSGGDDGVYPPPAPDTTRVPASAGASVSAFITYLSRLGADEAGEPLNIADFTPPVDDAAEPSPLP